LEAREIARRVRDHIYAGHAPDSVIVVADDVERRALSADALRRYGLPVEVAHEANALSAEAVRVVPALLELADEDVPRDRFVDLLSSRYIAGGIARGELPRGVSGGRVARAVREHAAASAHAADYPRAFAAWLAGNDARERVIAAHVLVLVAAIGALPAQATIARHIAALRRLLERLQLFSRARRVAFTAPPAPEARAADALLRDQAGLRRLEDLLDGLPRAAAQAGLASRSFSRRELTALFLEELAAASLAPGGGHGAAVRVCAPRDLVPRPAAFLVLAGAEEGALPRSSREHPLLPDDLGHVLERALDRKIFATARERDRSAVLAIARARAAATRVVVSYARADADGRPLFAGALVEHAEMMGARVHRAALDSVPRLRDARIFEELTARLLLEQSGDESAREGLSARTLGALRLRLDSLDATRVARIVGLSAIERGRADFFARVRAPGPFDGRLAVPPPIDALPGSAARPLSASTLGRYAECPHRFFLESVLRLRALEELGDDLDELSAGSLAHSALEHLFTSWRDAGLFPLRGRAEERALIEPAVEAAATAFRAEEPSGHEVLFRGRERALVRMLEAVWRKEVDDPPAAGFRPHGFEHELKGITVATDGAPIHIAGTIDRFDVHADADRVAVFDYKSGRLKPLTADLKPDAFGETSWQLPLYAAAMRETRGAREVTMSYYSLRDVKVAGAIAPEWLVLGAGTAEHPTLGDRLRALVAEMRAGRFDVEPRDGACDRCRMQAVCRVRPRRDDNEERP
jgi:RecB family exonuclease